MARKVERLVNLTIALLEARRPLTFAEIRRRTGYYSQDDTESARRMFERDKDDLRRLGVPIELRERAFEEEPGYLVARRTYELPDVELDADEIAALSLAVQLTGGEGTRLALTKLAARAPDPVEGPRRPPVRMAVHAEAVDAVAEAIVGSRAVRFSYRAADGRTGGRTVDPYAVVQRRGAWYLVGRDHDRDGLRSFRLDRVEGAIEALGPPGAFERPDDLDLDAAVSGPTSEGVRVVLAVDASARWAVESRGGVDTGGSRGGARVMHVDGIDPERDLAWLLGLAPDVIVLEPAELRSRMEQALGQVEQAHGGLR